MAKEPETAPNPMESCQGPTGFIFILAMGFLFLIMFNRDLGDSISTIIGYVLNPVIGFGGNYPTLTMLCSGLLTISVSTVIRHFMNDWVDMAKKQKILKEYNKMVKEATKSGDMKRAQKLKSENQDIMQMQSSMMMGQMKSSIISMVVAILIFRWLYSYISLLQQPTVTMPWDAHWPLTGSAFSSVCGTICINPGGGIPYWIFIYMFITIPIGQLMIRGFKYYEFSRKLKNRGERVFADMSDIEKTQEKAEEKKGGKKRKGKRKKKGE